MTKYLATFYNVLTQNEELKRLLVYKPEHGLDDPLSPDKNDIGMDWDLIDQVIMRSVVTDDLSNDSKCRICVYSGNRTPDKENYMYATQDIIFDVYVHAKQYDSIDFRLTTICDYLNKLVVNKHLTGLTKTRFLAGQTVMSPPSGFVGYRLYYRIGTSTK